MGINTKRMTLTGWVIALLLFSRVCPAYLGIEPLRTELSVSPGETLDGRIVLTNEKDIPVDIEVSFRDRSLPPLQGMDWIEIDTGEQHLAPRGTATVHYKIIVPEDVTGEFFGRVGFSEVTDRSPGTVAIRTMISVPIFVRVKGTEKYRGKITRVHLRSADPLNLDVEVVNQGNVHLRASGMCVLRDPESGDAVIRFPVNAQGFPLYPGITNTLVAASQEKPAPGDYICAVEIPFPDDQHRISGSFDLHVPGGEK